MKVRTTISSFLQPRGARGTSKICYVCIPPRHNSQDAVRATSSRFLSRCCFISYKMFLTTYFVFWTIYWPTEDNVDDAYLYVTYWTFYITAICEYIPCWLMLYVDRGILAVCVVSCSSRPLPVRINTLYVLRHYTTTNTSTRSWHARPYNTTSTSTPSCHAAVYYYRRFSSRFKRQGNTGEVSFLANQQLVVRPAER